MNRLLILSACAISFFAVTSFDLHSQSIPANARPADSSKLVLGPKARKKVELTSTGGPPPPPHCSSNGPHWALNANAFQLDGKPLIGQFVSIPFGQVKLQRVVNCIPDPENTAAIPHFSWQFITKPPASNAVFEDANSLTPKVWFDAGGDYTIRFVACPQSCVMVHNERATEQHIDLSIKAFSNATPKAMMFDLVDFQITKTMARGHDTDSAFLIAKNGGDLVGEIYNFLGDVDNGDYFLGWQFEKPLTFNGKLIVISYEFVNGGNLNSDNTKGAAKSLLDLAQGAAVVADIESAGVLQAFGPILDLAFPNCDGVVLAGNVLIVPPDFGHDIPPAEMAIQPSSLAGQPFISQTLSYRGPDTPTGCGSNAQYKVEVTLTPLWDPIPPPIVTNTNHAE